MTILKQLKAEVARLDAEIDNLMRAQTICRASIAALDNSPPQTITGSNVQTGTEMPVQPAAAPLMQGRAAGGGRRKTGAQDGKRGAAEPFIRRAIAAMAEDRFDPSTLRAALVKRDKALADKICNRGTFVSVMERLVKSGILTREASSCGTVWIRTKTFTVEDSK